jgi:hypothetical protein
MAPTGEISALLGKRWQGEVYSLTTRVTQIALTTKFYYPQRHVSDRKIRLGKRSLIYCRFKSAAAISRRVERPE